MSSSAVDAVQPQPPTEEVPAGEPAPMPPRDDGASPSPAATTTSAAPTAAATTYTRPTVASQSMSPGRAAREVSAPREVVELAHMSPRERVLLEHRRRRECARTARPSRNFAEGPERQGLLGRGSLAIRAPAAGHAGGAPPRFKSAQAKRAWEQRQAHQRTVEAEVGVTAPAPRTFSSHNWVDPIKVTKQRRGGLWARSTEERFAFNYSWQKFPQATPQASLSHRAPGPGSYGKSTSFLAS